MAAKPRPVDVSRSPDRAIPSPEGFRLIDASEWQYQRWIWMEGVRRDANLLPMARLVGHSLALDFAHHATLRCDPSFGAIASVVGTSVDTVKRSVGALCEAHWLARECGLGRGKKSGYGFLTNSKVVTLKGGTRAPQKGGAGAPISGGSKGGTGAWKRGHGCTPPIYKDKPYKNHGDCSPENLAPKTSTNPMVIQDAERAVAAFRSGRRDALLEAKAWVIDHILAADLLTAEELAAEGLAEKGGQ